MSKPELTQEQKQLLIKLHNQITDWLEDTDEDEQELEPEYLDGQDSAYNSVLYLLREIAGETDIDTTSPSKIKWLNK